MKVLILGFDNYQELDRVMNKLIEDSQCYLFYVICGGSDMAHPQDSLAKQWAQKNGAPQFHIYDNDMNKLLYKMENEADYLVLKLGKQSPQWQKNLMMRFKANGKHGTIIN